MEALQGESLYLVRNGLIRQFNADVCDLQPHDMISMPYMIIYKIHTGTYPTIQEEDIGI